MLKARSPFRTLAKHRTISPPPPSRQGRLFPPCRGNPVISLCALRGSLLRRPVELGPIDPHAVQNDRELARDGDLGLAAPVSLGELGSPSLQRRPFRHAGQQHAGRFEQIHAQHGVTALRDSAGPIHLPGGMASGGQSDIGTDTSRSLEARRIVDRCLECESHCNDRIDAILHVSGRAGYDHRYAGTIRETHGDSCCEISQRGEGGRVGSRCELRHAARRARSPVLGHHRNGVTKIVRSDCHGFAWSARDFRDRARERNRQGVDTQHHPGSRLSRATPAILHRILVATV